MVVVSNEGYAFFLRRIVSGDLTLHLYRGDVKPKFTDSLEAFGEVNKGGYAPIILRPEFWIVSEQPLPKAVYPKQTFKFTGPAGKVFGWYLQAGGKFVMGERFNTPSGRGYEIERNGDRIDVDPVIEFRLRRTEA